MLSTQRCLDDGAPQAAVVWWMGVGLVAGGPQRRCPIAVVVDVGLGVGLGPQRWPIAVGVGVRVGYYVGVGVGVGVDLSFSLSAPRKLLYVQA